MEVSISVSEYSSFGLPETSAELWFESNVQPVLYERHVAYKVVVAYKDVVAWCSNANIIMGHS